MKESSLSKRLKRLISDADKLVRDIQDDTNKLLKSLDELRKTEEEEKPDELKPKDMGN